MNPDTLLNVAHLLLRSRANGPGLRAVIWVQGCPILCAGCHNQEMLTFEKRSLLRPDSLIKRIVTAAPSSEGITLTGGEPFAQARACALMLKAAKEQGLTTMVYSGYTYRHLSEKGDATYRDMLALIDILVAGPYVDALRGTYRWKGSANQEVLFLSDAYSPNVLSRPAVDEELHVDGTGRGVITGFPISTLTSSDTG